MGLYGSNFIDFLYRNLIQRNDKEENNMGDIKHTIIEIQSNYKNGKESIFIEKIKVMKY